MPIERVDRPGESQEATGRKKNYLKRDGEWKGGEGKVYKTIPIQPNINRPFQNAFLWAPS